MFQLSLNFRIPVVVFTLFLLWYVQCATALEQRSAIAHPSKPYQLAFYHRHNPTYRVAGALHFAHSKLHDVLLLQPSTPQAQKDEKIYRESLAFLANPPRIEPSQELYAPYTARMAWRLFRVIDWAHSLHEMTYDIMADQRIPWSAKKTALDDALQHYLSAHPEIVLSPAPLDLTMRRAGVMMQPYFSLTRNYYPKANNFFYAAHWWHPATYEAMMVSGNDNEQEQALAKIDTVFQSQVLAEPPRRMLLSREMMPRYSRLSPETANIFDNLHMLHGITYDIFAHDQWTLEQKRSELYRVLDAMNYQPGDEQFARKFTTPIPDLNPLKYSDWLKGLDGTMTQMMLEMFSGMMQAMMSHSPMNDPIHHALTQQLKLKLTPGIQTNELPGSFYHSMHKLMPELKQHHQPVKPGSVNPRMTQLMVKNWRDKAAFQTDIDSYRMDSEPSIAELSDQ